MRYVLIFDGFVKSPEFQYPVFVFTTAAGVNIFIKIAIKYYN